MSFADRLSSARQRKSITGRSIAKALSVTPAAYSGWENGKREPSLEMVVKLCRLLDVSADYLLGLQTEPMPLNAQFLAGLTIPRTPYDDLSAESRKALDTYAQFLRSQESAAHEEETSS